MQEATMEGWDEFVESIKYVIDYGCHTNDMTQGEIEESLCHAVDQLAEKNGLPEVNWEAW